MTTAPRRSARRTAVALAPVAALVLIPATTAHAAAVRARATGSNTFRPKRVSVGVGTKVVWKAVSGRHTVTAYSNDWSKDQTIQPGDTTAFTFNSAGKYKYRCTLHSTLSSGVCSEMCGKVVVT